MILVIDAGNTNITIGAYRRDELVFVSRLATVRTMTEDQFAIDIKNIFLLHNETPPKFRGAVISSVVPEITVALKEAVKKITGCDPITIGPGIKTGLDIRVDSPASLGSDLVAGAVAAINKYPLPCLIMDLGTATKISVIDADGSFRGGIIAPGVEVSALALAQGASQLPQISLEAPEHVIATDTINCMRSGIIYGTADMLDGICRRMQRELSTEIKTVVATGGIAGLIVPHCSQDVICDKNLLLEGLKIIYDKNTK